MNLLKVVCACWLALGASVATAQEAAFMVDPDLFNQIYSESRAAAHNHHETWMVTAAVGARGTDDLIVRSDQFETDYNATQDYLPSVYIGVGRGVWQGVGFVGEIGLEVGYASLRGTFEARSNEGVAVEDNMVLQVLPIVVRHSVLSAQQWGGWVQPMLTLEAERAWVNQVGSIDGTATSTWRSAIGAGIGVRILKDEVSGFGGLTLSSSYSVPPQSGRAGRMSHSLGSRLML